MASTKIRKMVSASLFTAMSLILINMVHFPVFTAFLVYDPGDIPLVFAAFSLGILPALAATVIVSLFQALFLSTDGWVGALMHIISTGLLVCAAGLTYRLIRSTKGVVIGAVLGTLAMTLGMIIANLTITVWFYGLPREAVEALLLPAIIPFNLIKAGANATVAAGIYILIKKILKNADI